MRLIDADALKETIHIHHYPLRDGINSIDNGMWTIGIYQAIDETPTIDAVEVVRCRECKYRFANNNRGEKGCPIVDSNIWMDDEDFCSHGERKEASE